MVPVSFNVADISNSKHFDSNFLCKPVVGLELAKIIRNRIGSGNIIGLLIESDNIIRIRIERDNISRLRIESDNIIGLRIESYNIFWLWINIPELYTGME